jgi:hypothetical protein
MGAGELFTRAYKVPRERVAGEALRFCRPDCYGFAGWLYMAESA